MTNLANFKGERFYPCWTFMPAWERMHSQFLSVFFTLHPKTGLTPFNLRFAAKSVLEAVKSEEGRKAFAELHEHLGLGPTFCVTCLVKTGDRDGYYEHHKNNRHLRKAYQKYFDDPTSELHIVIMTLVNVLKKD
ncbi:hypothetical protein PMAYCL1PPCAC_25000, partial [Pristionchus mayeri]